MNIPSLMLPTTTGRPCHASSPKPYAPTIVLWKFLTLSYCTRGITPAQIALLADEQEAFIVPIPGTTKLSHLEENLRACDIRFTAEEIEELETAVAAIPVVGSRYDALQESKIPK